MLNVTCRRLLIAAAARTVSHTVGVPPTRIQPLAGIVSRAFSDRAKLADRMQGFDKPSVWVEFSPLSVQTGSVNLGQGFPDWETPLFMKEAARDSIYENNNQYTSAFGHGPLLASLSEHYSPLFGRDLAPSEITTTVGSSEGLFATMQALINPGDEVILIEPAFDIYAAQIQMAGGVVRYVPLRPTGDNTNANTAFHLDMEELRSAFSPRTRLLLVNTPQNPTGKVFSRSELEDIRSIVLDHDRVVVLSDEVYENLVYDGQEHVRIATLPDMWDRTLTLSSAGKTFSATGWKIGWAVGPQPLVSSLALVNQWVQYCVATPLQDAVARALKAAKMPYEGHSDYYSYLLARYEAKRERLMTALQAAGLPPVRPCGSFFIMADTSGVEVPQKYLEETTPAAPVMTRDWAFCRWLTLEHGVTPIPPSAFYSEPNKELAANYVRFAFCKQDDSLELAAQRLSNLTTSKK